MAKRNNTEASVVKIQKKAKQVTGNTTKLKKLTELKKVNKQIEKVFKTNNKRFERNDKLFNKAQKLKEQLGIDLQ